MINYNNLDTFPLDFDSDLNTEKNINPQNSFEIAYKSCFNEELYKNEEPLNADYLYQYYQNENSKTKESTKEKVEENIQNISKTEKEDKLLGKKRKLGRKKNIEKIKNNNENIKKIHNDKVEDNMLNKIQIHSINSIIEYFNSILDYIIYNDKERFLNIDSSFKKKINKKEREELKKKKLCDILKLNISKKYTKHSFDYNKNLYEKIEKMKENPIYEALIKLSNENYLYFFQNIYYKNERIINLNKYGINITIPLTKKVELCEDKIKSFKDKDEEYIKKYKKCINENYFNGKLMFISEK